MRQSWNEKTLTKAAVSCTSKGELRKISGARDAALKLGIWDKITAHMPKNVNVGREPYNKKWRTKEDILPFSSQCKRRTEFYERFPQAYQGAKDLKILDEVCAHMPKDASIGRAPHNKKWTLRTIPPESLKYTNVGDFIVHSRGAYNAARDLGILDEVCSHMNFVWEKKWNEETLSKAALECDCKTELNEKYPGAKGAAKRLEIWKKITSHMKPDRTSSKPERDILKTVLVFFPSAKKIKDYSVKIKNKPYIKSFEIDIFIPEFNLGIEFDGSRYHSFEYMRKDKKKAKWSDTDIHNYHKLKDSWFSTKGIEILHIKEKDWDKDRQACLDKCLIFLGVKNG